MAKGTFTLCLMPECKGPVYSRGLCPLCYYAAHRLIGDRRTSWEQLEAKGKALPPKRNKSLNRVEWFLS